MDFYSNIDLESIDNIVYVSQQGHLGFGSSIRIDYAATCSASHETIRIRVVMGDVLHVYPAVWMWWSGRASFRRETYR